MISTRKHPSANSAIGRSGAGPTRRRFCSLAVAAAVLTLGVLASACSKGLTAERAASNSDGAVATSTAASATDVGLLFSVTAPTMQVVAEGTGFRVTIAADSPTAWFTDRPARTAGSFDVVDLVSLWSAEGFDTDPPNAAVVVSANGEQHQHVVELSDPKVTGTTVSFHADDIGDDDGTDPVAGRSATHDVVVGSFGESELFIDDGGYSPCPSSINGSEFYPCLIPANGSVAFTASSVRPNTFGEILQVTPNASSNGYFNIAPYGGNPATSIPWVSNNSNTHSISEYYSGQKWTVKNGAAAVGFTVEMIGANGGNGYDGGDDDDD